MLTRLDSRTMLAYSYDATLNEYDDEFSYFIKSIRTVFESNSASLNGIIN